jgi:RNA polymerase sigma-70 factor (ECF subfamily)
LSPDDLLEQYRRELTGYCYRMLGSSFEAEDAVQETLLRAWRASESLEDPAALRAWLYRIATNVCMTMLDGRRRRALPMDLGSPSPPTSPLGAPLADEIWIQPMPDSRSLDGDADPAELVVARESLRLAFVAALQHLPPRQRAALILRDVLKWKAAEVAELLDTSTVSVNGLLHRARAALASLDPTASRRVEPAERERELLDRYVDAFERYDIAALVSLLRDDAVFAMPPFALWLRGRIDVRHFLLTHQHNATLVPVESNASPAYAIYHLNPSTGRSEAFGIQVLELTTSGISTLQNFLEPGLFSLFGLPTEIPVGGR